ncbi:3-keto-steroid reductase [Elasticomyces elasticus]|nr:3-keto-steroid reductase [Elasticomyces elasticus]KAK5010249.1 hypothetical protein LTR28_011011 [Elasticomyces elasticus]
MAGPSNEDAKSVFTVLVTGANSGLGFAICCRLITEFLSTRPQTQTLRLILTTRSRTKCHDTLARLRAHLQSVLREANGKTLGISLLLEPRIHLEGETVELTSLLGVKTLAGRLLARRQKIDCLICNAGIGGWKGMDWPRAIWTILTDLLNAATYPTFKRGYVGLRTKRQIPPDDYGKQLRSSSRSLRETEKEEPVLGEVFTANVFGHYMLAHWIAPLLRSNTASASGEEERARIIWISSLEAYPHALDMEDLQGLKTDMAYESSKRLTDLLVLTAGLPPTRPYVSSYFSATPHPNTSSIDSQGPGEQQKDRPVMYLSHPGICGTAITALPSILIFFMNLSFYLARLLGSPWHTTTAWSGACAPVWLALSPHSLLEGLERKGGKGKWGSATNTSGADRVIRTEVSGWGWGGQVGEKVDGGMRMKRGRWRGMKELTQEGREDFELLGAEVWKKMEGLRMEWEERLSGLPEDSSEEV